MDEFYKTNVAACPCCGTPIRLHLNIEVLGVFVAEDAASLRVGEFMARRVVTPEVMETINQLKAQGVIDSFREVYQRSNPGGGVKNFERYFVTWAELASPAKVSSFFHRDYAAEFGVQPEDIEFFSHASLVGVTARGALRCFVPQQFLKETPLHKLDPTVAAVQPKPILGIRSIGKEYQLWKRTKHGYIVGNGEFFKELRKRSVGDFAKTVGNF